MCSLCCLFCHNLLRLELTLQECCSVKLLHLACIGLMPATMCLRHVWKTSYLCTPVASHEVYRPVSYPQDAHQTLPEHVPLQGTERRHLHLMRASKPQTGQAPFSSPSPFIVTWTLASRDCATVRLEHAALSERHSVCDAPVWERPGTQHTQLPCSSIALQAWTRCLGPRAFDCQCATQRFSLPGPFRSLAEAAPRWAGQPLHACSCIVPQQCHSGATVQPFDFTCRPCRRKSIQSCFCHPDNCGVRTTQSQKILSSLLPRQALQRLGELPRKAKEQDRASKQNGLGGSCRCNSAKTRTRSG